MLTAELIDDPAGLEPWVARWDALATEVGAPYCAPAWMISCWHHTVAGDARLRTVIVHDGGELVGLAPYFVQLHRLGLAEYRVLGAGISHRIGPIARAGHEDEVAAALTQALAAADPAPSSFLLEGVDRAAPWPDLIRTDWPGRLRPTLRKTYMMNAPTLSLEGEFEEWYESQSANFRQKMRQKRRQMEKRGGEIRMVTEPDEADRVLDSMIRQHRERWAARGLEGSLQHGMEEHLRSAVPALLPEQRARLWSIFADGEAVSTHLFFTAGGEVASWGGGFEPEWASVSPAQLVILAAVEDAFRRQERRVDWGGGILDYKLRFANGDDPVEWVALFPKNARYPLTRARMMPKAARLAARNLYRRLPEPTRDRLQGLRGRAKGR
ncbi:MAG TPA: GNAT family N-acetyltransferase [Thermoleophilaceae bacterium]